MNIKFRLLFITLMASSVTLASNIFSLGFSLRTLIHWVILWIPTVLFALAYHFLFSFKLASGIISKLAQLFNTSESNIIYRHLHSLITLVLQVLGVGLFALYINGVLLNFSISTTISILIRAFVLAFIFRIILKPLSFKILYAFDNSYKK